MKKLAILALLSLGMLAMTGCGTTASPSTTASITAATTVTETTGTTTTTTTTTTATTTTTTHPLREDETSDIVQDFDLTGVDFAAPFTLIRFHSVLSDHAVLQQKKTIRVFGTATPGTIALVKLVKDDDPANQSQNYGFADENGQFLVELPALTASFDTYTLTVSDTVHEIKITDLLIGEVWIAGGQSNMGLKVSEMEEGAATMAAADNDRIRIFYQDEGDHNGIYPVEPALDVRNGVWKTANSGADIAACSGIGYIFAKELFRLLSEERLSVPIGILNTPKGGSNLHSWLPREAMLECDPLKDYVLAKGLTFSTANYNTSGWNNYNQPSALFNQKIAPLFNFQIGGVLWYQGESDPFYDPTIEAIPLLIDTWSRGFNQNDDLLPFVLVQLAPYDGQDPFSTTPNPDFVYYAAHRQAQLDVVQMDKYAATTVLVPIYDVSLVWDVPLTRFAYANAIHPTTKIPVGERAGKEAYTQFYYGAVDFLPPMVDSFVYDATSITITFIHVARGLKTFKDSALGVTTVAVYLKNGIRQNAACVLLDAFRIQITGIDTTQIAYFAYGYLTRNEKSNLSSSYGIPAIPFKIALN